MPFAVITLGFDPTVYFGPFAVRWETLGLAAAILAALLLAAAYVRADHGSGRSAIAGVPGRPALRLDDLLYLAVAAVPGAVVGGRLVLALDFLDYYQAHTGALLDPGQGSLSLLGAVLGGTITVVLMCRLLQVPVRRWLDTLAVPLLVAIGLGKLAYLLGGGGQGVPWNGPWAVAFTGPGPWLSALASVPAHPSQVYEGAWTLVGALVVGLATFASAPARSASAGPARVSAFHAGVGLRYAFALAWWLLGRAIVGFTWTNPPAVAGLDVEQIAALVVLCLVGVMVAWQLRPGAPIEPEIAGDGTFGDGVSGVGASGGELTDPSRDGPRTPGKPRSAPRRPA